MFLMAQNDTFKASFKSEHKAQMCSEPVNPAASLERRFCSALLCSPCGVSLIAREDSRRGSVAISCRLARRRDYSKNKQKLYLKRDVTEAEILYLLLYVCLNEKCPLSTDHRITPRARPRFHRERLWNARASAPLHRKLQ